MSYLKHCEGRSNVTLMRPERYFVWGFHFLTLQEDDTHACLL